MGDLMVGLAKTVVEAALNRARAAIEEESELRWRSQRNLLLITLELEMIHSFLGVAADDQRLKNMMVRTRVRQVREMAYDFQDCIEFVVHLEMDNRARWWLRLVPSFMAPPPLLDQAVADLEELKVRAEELSKYYTRYSRITDSESKLVMMQQQASGAVNRTITLNLLTEARGTAKKHPGYGDLTRLITERQDYGLQVVSVWGAGADHGTTSVIRKTFNHPKICQDFTYRAWVQLTHPFSPHDFIRSIMAQFYAKACKEEEGATIGMHVLTKMEAAQADLFSQFEKLVTQQRYLVVFEGLASMIQWDAVRTFLPNTENGSWIIVSAQQSEIAALCTGHSHQISELKRFSDEHSVCALFKASQGDGKKNKEPKSYQGDEDKGKSQMAYKEMQIGTSLAKSMSFKRIASEKWMKKNYPLFGRDLQIKELDKYIAKACDSPRRMMSVLGIAGVGKSSLVKTLYCEKMPHSDTYEDYYWMDVSHPFNLWDMYLTLLSDFHSEKDPTEECHRLLEENRCLIVIDGLRSTAEWDLIQAALVTRHSSSVVIVITSDASVATYCTNKGELVFNVNPLEGYAAVELFRKQVLKKIGFYPSRILDWEVEFIVKCGGIPKVIVVVAGLLITEMIKNMDAHSLHRRIMHHLEYDSLQDLFQWMHSYFNTFPDSLKPCIFYLSIFPCGHIIRRRRIVRRWIAEGYSRDSHIESVDENGEKHFSKLLELSLTHQVSSESWSSVTSTAYKVDSMRMVRFQVNGFIQEYIMSRQMEEDLLFELGENYGQTTLRTSTGRHLVILKNWDRDEIKFKNIDFSRLRSLTVFGKWESFFISKSMKMLRVLDLEDASGSVDYKDLEKMLKWLRRLKFLSLRGQRDIYHLPSSLGHLGQLQTLDIRDTSIVTLPESVTKLQKLQYIRDSTTTNIEPAALTPPASCSSRFCRSRRHIVGVEVPRGVGELIGLHTLGVVNVATSRGKAVLEELEKLTQLRKLGLTGINRNNSIRFVSLMDCLGHLESLSVQLDMNIQDYLDDSLPRNLQSLKLYGLKDKLPQTMWELEKLRKLDLEMDTLSNTELEKLADLRELSILRLQVKQQHQESKLDLYLYVDGEQSPIFIKVNILEIACSSSRLHVTFGSESMQNLELLKIDCSSAYYQLTGLNYLSELKHVWLKGTNDEELKTDLENQLVNHPKTPAVKLEGLPDSS